LSDNPYQPPEQVELSPLVPPVHEALPRVLGPLDAVAIVVGSIIGSGIFLKAGQVAKGLNSFGLVIAVWVVVGIVTLFGSLSLAELAAMMPHAGGPYVYLRAAYGRLVAFLWCWAEFWIIRTGSVGALACATAIYLDAIIPMGRTGQLLVAVVSVAGLTLINAAGVRWGARVQNATTLIKVSFLVSLIVVPLLWGKTDTANLEPVWPQTFTMSLWPALGLAMINVLWPYDGWVNIAPVAEEIREPQRNVPIALVTGMAVVMLLYVGAVASYHLVLPMDQVIKSDAIAADVCGVLLGEWGRVIAAGAVMCSTFGALNSNLLCGPRIYLAAARDGLLPAALHHISPTRRTPANAILLQGFWGIVLIVAAFAWKSGPQDRPKDAFDELTAFVIFGATVFYALAVAAVFVLRRTQPQLERPYRAWGYPFTPALYLAAFAAAMVSLFYEKFQPTMIGSVLILAGALYYWVACSQETSGKAKRGL
jgi:basic amino acid/polyamine antiporter, APA family